MYLDGFMPTFINNTISENTVSYPSTYGIGIFSNNCNPQGKNNIVYNNHYGSTVINYSGTVNFTYSLSVPQFTGTGNVTGNPLFVDPAGWDFNLQAGSPCIDTGDPSSPLDPDSTRADMGAFYYDQGISYPEFAVDLTYISGSPVPAIGGQLLFDIFAQNNSGQILDLDAWLAVEYEGGPPTTVVLRPLTNFQPGWAINRPNTTFPVPGAWAAGNYEHFGRVGEEPDLVWNEDSFPWVKSGVSDGSYFQPYPVAGADDPFDTIDKSGGVLPTEHTLIEAYPNPFNPSTALSFQLSASGHVNLSIYDVTGSKVATLIDGERMSGMYDLRFDGSDLPSGIYFARLTAGDLIQTQKLVLMK